MSKKKKRKLKKALYAQLKSQEAAKPPQAAPADTTTQPSSEVSEARGESGKRALKTQAAEEEIEGTEQVRQEAKKILLTALVLALAIAAIFFVNEKTDFILKAGAFLFGELNLNV